MLISIVSTLPCFSSHIIYMYFKWINKIVFINAYAVKYLGLFYCVLDCEEIHIILTLATNTLDER